MKSTRNLLIGMVITGSLAASLPFLHAQTTATTIQAGTASLSPANLPALKSLSDAQLEALLKELAATPLIWPDALPRGGMGGTYWSLVHPGWPPLPQTAGRPVWQLTSGSGSSFYLLDDLDYPETAATSGGLMTPDGSGWPGGITNIGNVPLVTRPVYTTNDLWLEITGKSNTTAFLTIHEPWNVTNNVYDLFYTTNLSAPETWSWVLRSFAGLTNLTVNNATDQQGFYRLGQTNDFHENNSLGTNFWVAFDFMLHDIYGNFTLSLYISSPVGASGTVSNSALGINRTFTVAAGAVTNISIPGGAMLYDYDAVEDYGIHVTASQPVSVYAMNYAKEGLSAAFTGYPTTVLGTNYCVIGYQDVSEFAVVATADNTTVTITPSPTASLEGSLWNNPITNLQAGETYQIESFYAGGDVTGTWIASDKPIAVFAGASGADVPDERTGAANPLLQEQMPVDSWGTLALGLSFAGRTNGDSYRVLAAYSNTVVTITGTVVTIVAETNQYGPWSVTKTNEVVVTNLDAGQFCDIIVEGPVVFQADKPIQVAQFANGILFDLATDASGNPVGDPCEILLPPTGHYLVTNTIVTLTNDAVTGDFYDNFLNVIVPQSAITNTFVDTLLVASNKFVAIGTSGYYGAQIVVTNSGAHTVTSSRPVEVQVYGFGDDDAYSYLGGWVK